MAAARRSDVLGLELFAITPGRGDADEIVRALPAIVERSARALLLREKQLDEGRRRALATTIAPRCRDAGVALWISDDVELALAVGAAGVQLSERAPSPLVVRRELVSCGASKQLALGVSLHDPVSRSRDELATCAHAFLGPLFATPSKPGVKSLGIERFVELAASLPCPVFAVGGVSDHHLVELVAAGVHRAAAIRLFFGSASRGAAGGSATS